MKVLIQGLEFTNQLHLLLLQNSILFEKSALDLTTKIHQSFISALSLLNTCSAKSSNTCSAKTSVDGGTSCDEVFIDYEILSNNPDNPVIMDISSNDHRKSTDRYSGESKNKAIPCSSTDHDLKVGCKRRKSNSDTWVRVTPTSIDDGHAWRKYGQKDICNTDFPRCYYRCTHRNEQGCKATKQVQKTQNKPSMYQTTYMGHHTCKEITSMLDTIPDLMLDEIDPSDTACVINFQTNLTTKQPYTFSSSFSNTSVEHELIQHNAETYQEDYPGLKNIAPIDNDLTMSDFHLLADLRAFDSISREMLEVLGGQQVSMVRN